jgi:hypothetical protein
LDIADDDEGQGQQSAGAQTLHRAGGDQLGHARRKAAEQRADQEDPDRDHIDRSAPVDVRELAEDRADRGRGEHVDGEDPAVALEAPELGDDGRHGGRDDRALHGSHEQTHHHPEGDQDDATLLQADPLCLSLASSVISPYLT